jgi:hypothetical protein
MNTVVTPRMMIKAVHLTNETITADLMDGRNISVPLEWSWRLAQATPEQQAHFEIIGNGHGVHWPDIDEDLSAAGMLCGTPAPRPKHRQKSYHQRDDAVVYA